MAHQTIKIEVALNGEDATDVYLELQRKLPDLFSKEAVRVAPQHKEDIAFSVSGGLLWTIRHYSLEGGPSDGGDVYEKVRQAYAEALSETKAKVSSGRVL